MSVPKAILVDDSEDDDDVRIIASPRRKGHKYVFACLPIHPITLLHSSQARHCSACSAMSILISTRPRTDKHITMTTFPPWTHCVRTSYIPVDLCQLIRRMRTAPPSSGSRPRFQPSRVKSSPTKGISFFNTTDKDRFWYHSLGTEPPSNYTPG